MVAAAHAICGVGAEISSLGGRVLGRVVAEEKRGWRLDSGKVMHANAEGRRWRWAALPAATTPAEAQKLLSISPFSLLNSSDTSCDDGTDRSLSPLLLPRSAPDWAADAKDVIGYELDVKEIEPVSSGVGARIVGSDGTSWGVAVAEERGCWRLRDGRVARKATEGRKWRWAET